MVLSSDIIKRLSLKEGYDVTTPEGAYHLSLDIHTQTCIRLSRNTVNRLVGVLMSTTKPRVTTLDTVAICLGYPNWGHLLQNKPTLREEFYKEKNLHMT